MERVKPEIQERVNEHLRELIQEVGNVTAFADSIGVSRDSVNNWLRGKSDIRLNDLVKISKQHGVSTDWLLGLSDIRTPDKSISGAVAVTGLSEQAIKNICNSASDILCSLLELDDFINLLDEIDSLDMDVGCCKREIAETKKAINANVKFWGGRLGLDDLEDFGGKISSEEWIARSIFVEFKSDFANMRLAFKDIEDTFSEIMERITGISDVITDGKDLLKTEEDMLWRA